jgi:tetratricopeptide (TPR) repeat protein
MATATLEPGIRIGKYEVLAHIATGGMGSVYKAKDLELGRTVALKVLQTNLAQGERLSRFKQEARSAASLNYLHIVTLFEYGYDAYWDVHFLAMEFIDGINLEAYVKRRGQLEPEEARVMLVQAANALDHAYQHGIVHRDIKPSNFMLARVGKKVVLKLTDLGLARPADDEQYSLTREGCTVGTIDYIAPEQARDSRAADIRSDIYSLGCTAYHLLAGKAPFAEGGLGERVFKHIEAPPPDVREANPEVSAEFCALIQRMMAKKPEDRPQTPADLLGYLKRVTAARDDTASTVAEVAARRPTVVDPSTTSVVPPSTPATAPQQSRAAALHKRAVQVLAEGGGEEYARQLLSNCLALEPFCIPYRRTLRETYKKASGNTLGRWLRSLNVLAVKTKMRRARAAGNWLKVLEHGEEVLARQPADVDAHLHLAKAAGELGQPHLAIWMLEQGCSQVPDSSTLMSALAELYEQTKELKLAIALWEKVRAAEPDNAVARRKINDLSAQAHITALG